LTALDLGEVAAALGAISSIAVIAGAGFIVVQLRQNATLLKASLRQEREQVAFSMVEKLTHETFAHRRANFYQVVKRYGADGWKGFDDSADDFEVRNYAYFFELYGQMVKDGIIDLAMVAEMLQYIVIFDWKTFEPVSEHLKARFGLKVSPWQNFEWLSKETDKFMSAREAAPDLSRGDRATPQL
jgi:hypothetical protein